MNFARILPGCHLLLGLLCCGMLGFSALAAEDGLRVVLKQEAVEISRPFARLSDIAELSGDEALVQRAAAVTVRRLPDLATYRIDAAEVRATLRRHLSIEAQVSGEVSLRRESQRWDAGELSAIAIEHLEGRAEDRQITVRVRRDPSPQVVAADAEVETTVVAEPLTDTWWGDVPYRLRIMRGEQEIARTLCVLEVHAWREMPVAARALARGDEISLGDVVMKRVEIRPGSQSEALRPEDVVGHVAIRHIPPGTPIASGWARPEPDVKQGTTILLVYEGDGFTLAVHAEALTNGSTGERVRVRSDQGKTVYAEVRGPNEVVIRQVLLPE